MSLNYLLLLLLFPLTFKTGFSAEISVSVPTGDSVQLDIQTQQHNNTTTQQQQFDFLFWRTEKNENIVKYFHNSKEVRLHSSYKDRVNFNNEIFSLTLKNMQKTDSGLYTAGTSGESENNIVTYRVSVIDAVEAPVLTVNSNRSSSDSCTVNFTCRAHELMIDSSYQNNSCSPEEVTSQINTLILDCSEESIICNHSNPVSWKEDRINIIQLCNNNKKNDSKNDKTGSSLLWPVVASGAMAVIILIIIFLSVFLYCRRKKASRNAET
uniref:Si:dkey-53k12.1 n=1 Tax=Cyprinus carpio TaxID=7962 RepID=A0A8C2A6B4_CYPCA